MNSLSLGYSPCPNDTYVFYALVHGLLPGAPAMDEVLEDIETLNGMALRQELDVVKVSFHALGHMRQDYCLLRAGGALGRGCGPLVVGRQPWSPDELVGKRIAIPGRLTTAALLLRLFGTAEAELVEMPFDRIMPATEAGEVDAGLIIHESRFTYPQHGLHKVVDLGEWWEAETGHPIPLGGILARRALGLGTIGRVDRALRQSVEYAHARAAEVKGYVRRHAQEMDEAVMQAHIDLYVNDYTLDYGADGVAAIEDLMRRAVEAEVLPAAAEPLFVA